MIAHELIGLTPDNLWHAWTFEPTVVVPLLAAVLLYAVGVLRLWRTAGPGQGVSVAEVTAFYGGSLAVAVALISPLDALSDALFSAHMLQHELLILAAAPLMVLGAPLTVMLWALPMRARLATVRAARARPVALVWVAITAPAVTWLVHAVALWVWHAPVLYQAALEHDGVHALQHACFFFTAALFWWGLKHGRYGRLGYGAAVVYVFATATQSGILGALLTLSSGVWYPLYRTTSEAWGLSPLEDQQLAGLLMWVPTSAVFVLAALAFFAAWLRESGRRARYQPDVRVNRARSFLAWRRERSASDRLRSAGLLVICLAMAASACTGDTYREAAALTGGDPSHGREAITKYGCDTCHVIPGVRTANGHVGPPLSEVALRVYLAGHLPNTPANMQAWIKSPHKYDRETVMPETGVSESDVRDITAYLYTLR